MGNISVNDKISMKTGNRENSGYEKFIREFQNKGW